MHCCVLHADRMDKVRALITGPEDTPYYGGCFFFDAYFPQVRLLYWGLGCHALDRRLLACRRYSTLLRATQKCYAESHAPI